ncbi:thioredoxin family protein [Fluviispira vulneris]|uniref:thioredoxin family protein n=1 Tax=Fluviispira vulneris TaxID=2763012 RepID=UPI001644D73A|nr:thioredoxin family protein [Fluviispira vulneris]
MSEIVELNDDNGASELKKENLALIDYYAPWCGSCRMALPMFKKIANELGLPLYKIDAEKNENLRGLIEIENLPTVAIWKDDKMIASICTTKEEGLRSFLKSHGIGG